MLILKTLFNDDQRRMITRRAVDHLIKPWGILSLNEADPDFHPKHLKPFQHRSAGNEYEERLHQAHVPLKKIRGMVVNYPIRKFEADHLRERAPFPIVARHRKTGEWHRI